MTQSSQPPSNSHDSASDMRRQRQQNRRYVLQNRWEILSHLGQGGMGTVYMARDLRLANRQCVVKKLRDDFFRQEDKEKALLFFQREAFVLSRLQHPNIVHILDYFEENGDYFLVMEYVEGENLQQLLQAQHEPFPEQQVLAWAQQIAEVLHYLHSHDPPVIYRDLKPSNVMIDNLGRVKLVDFGIARPFQEDSDNTHVVSAGYSPPEQYWGAADPRSDIYALGATMYFLLTTHEPLALQTSLPKKVNPKVSERVDHLVQRATSQDIWLRFQTAPEMKEAIDACLNPSLARQVKLSSWLVACVALVIAGLSIFAYIHFLDITKGREDARGKALRLEQQLKEANRRGHSKDRELELLRDYTNSERETSEGRRQPAVQLQNEAPSSIQANSLAASSLMNSQLGTSGTPPAPAKMTVAFKEEDEAQLTDPDGFPNENQLPNFDNDSPPGSSSKAPQPVSAVPPAQSFPSFASPNTNAPSFKSYQQPMQVNSYGKQPYQQQPMQYQQAPQTQAPVTQTYDDRAVRY
ncbi:MAG TPA: serine/threonine-protein kinase [Oculatellaceae cyanobacterium]